MAHWVSEELAEVLATLTAKQATGILRIVEGEMEGRSLPSLLEGPDKICAWGTYHGGGKSKGWKNKPEFKQALTLARRDLRAFRMERSGIAQAAETLAATAPAAAAGLRQRVLGDDRAVTVLEWTLTNAGEAALRKLAASRLGMTGLPRVVEPLETALTTESNNQVREAIVEALGMVAGGRARDLEADESVLDRADIKTAIKEGQAVALGVKVATFEPDLSVLTDEELASLAALREKVAQGE